MRIKRSSNPISRYINLVFLTLACSLAYGGDPANGPTVTRMYAVDKDVLAIEIIEGRLVKGHQVPYEADPSDELVADGADVLAWRNGQAQWVPKNIKLFRQVNGKRTEIGYYIESENLVTLHTVRQGSTLNLTGILDTGNYRLTSTDDADFGETGSQPLSVARKSKPHDEGRYGKGQSVRHILYLKWPHILKTGRSYELQFSSLNTQESTVAYMHGNSGNWTEVIHVNQVGYHPEDQFKHALLSLWKGTGGAHDYDAWIGQPFKIVDVFRNKAVYTGSISKLMDDSEYESQFINGVNNAQTSVYGLEFSNMKESGLFRIEIDGLGCSHVFPVKASSWLDAFRVSMMGFLHHRSGIELGPPFTDYKRPLCFHPDNGTKPLQTDVMTVSGESDVIRESLGRLAGTAAEVPEAWGGYMDAGDWDRRSQHLDATYLHLELFEMFSDYYENVSLNLPAEESVNPIPDLLDEALWNVEFYQRLQMEHGGVRGGVESTEHPRSGEASWQESLLVGVFAPDAVSSYRFAACAAKAGRLLQSYDVARSNALMSSAVRAWAWAEANSQSTIDGVPEDKRNKTTDDLSRNRATAAVELFRNMGEPGYHSAFEEEVAGLDSNTSLREKLRDALFAYVNLPDGMGDSSLKAVTRQTVIDLAELALDFQQANPYGIASDNRYLPMMGYTGYYSVPGMISKSLPRAHYLTGDPRYLAGTVGACNFPNGANPDNLCYTTGLGQYNPTSPLHVDMHVIGAKAPAGITVYGPSDPAAGYSFNEWVHVWRLGAMEPDSRTWPAAEWFVNLPDWPAMTEYTIHQTLGPTSYYWGYIAGAMASGSVDEPGVGQDMDQDGLEDAIEYAIILAEPHDDMRELSDVIPEQDFDGDGKTNYEEMLAGTLAHVAGLGQLYVVTDYQGGVGFFFEQAENGLCQFKSSSDFINWANAGTPFDRVGAIHQAEIDSASSNRLFVQVLKIDQ